MSGSLTHLTLCTPSHDTHPHTPTLHTLTHTEHQNFFGVDETLGPIAISLKRERVPYETCDFYNIHPTPGNNVTVLPKYKWRIIFRTSQVSIYTVYILS